MNERLPVRHIVDTSINWRQIDQVQSSAWKSYNVYERSVEACDWNQVSLPVKKMRYSTYTHMAMLCQSHHLLKCYTVLTQPNITVTTVVAAPAINGAF